MADAHSSHVAHQFDTAEQQRQASAMGMWVFLVTEVMFFGGLFLGYVVYRSAYPHAWAEGSHHLSIALGATNTIVLIFSSLTMAMAVRSAQLADQKNLVRFLLSTMLLGGVFLGIKLIEYKAKIDHHLVPGPHFHLDSPLADHIQLFFSFYFTMTGMHALHMIIGEGVMAFLVVKSMRGAFSEAYYAPIEITGLYWHFIDIIWIFLFYILYLIGRHLS